MGEGTKIELFNGLTLQEFKDRLLKNISLDYASKGYTYPIDLNFSDFMNKADLDACFNLIEYTSKDDYQNSTIRWKPRAKKAEMKLVDMRYLLIRKHIDSVVIGFASFMLTYENDQEVIYLYEIHLADELRGLGFGKHLMDVVESIGQNAGVEKMMLTVFVRNEHASEWYDHLGFKLDEFEPEPRRLRNGVVKQSDHRILSRRLP